MCAMGCRCARHSFTVPDVRCHGKRHIMAQHWGKFFASLTTSSVFERFSKKFGTDVCLGSRCARHIFRQWQKVRCHGNSILWHKIGGNKTLRRGPYLPQFLNDSHDIWHRCMGCRRTRHIFRQCQESGNCILWQQHYGKHCGLNYFHIFMHLKVNLAHMLDVWCSCVRHIFRQWRKVLLPW